MRGVIGIKYIGSKEHPFEEVTEIWNTPGDFIRDLEKGNKGLHAHVKILAIVTGMDQVVTTRDMDFMMEDLKKMYDKSPISLDHITSSKIEDYCMEKL